MGGRRLGLGPPVRGGAGPDREDEPLVSANAGYGEAFQREGHEPLVEGTAEAYFGANQYHGGAATLGCACLDPGTIESAKNDLKAQLYRLQIA